MTQYAVHKLNAHGELMLSYDAELDTYLPNGVRLAARWTRPRLALGYTTFETGDRFTEEFYSDRWYNIFRIAAANRRLKGWYCNITEPATITDTKVASRDLLLDLWVAPDGTVRVLDEDEFAAATSLSIETRAEAERALADLIAQVQARHPPFDEIP